MAQLPLRPWQEAALAAWTKIGCRGIVEVATGGGKTRFALAAAAEWLQHHSKGLVLIVVPTTALLDQWVLALDQAGVPEHRVAAWPGTSDIGAQFHIMVVNTARRRAPALRTDETLLIADECHRYASPENSKAIQIDALGCLGLTATAEREFDDGLEEVLVPTLGPLFYEYSLGQARTDGVLSPFQLTNVEIPLQEDEAEQVQRLGQRIQRAWSAGNDELAKILALRRSGVVKSARMRIPTTVALMEGHRGKRALLFHEDIRTATSIADLLSARGHSVGLYHSYLGAALRRDNLRQFRDGILDILVTCRALDEGVDVPEAELAVIVAASTSRRQRIQRLGRVLRRSAEKDLARVFTLYATPSEESRLVAEQSELTDVAEINWLRASVRSNA